MCPMRGVCDDSSATVGVNANGIDWLVQNSALTMELRFFALNCRYSSMENGDINENIDWLLLTTWYITYLLLH